MTATSLKNKTVFITGASSGIGVAAAHAFAQEGAKFILTARRVDRLKKLAEDLKKQYGAESHCMELDIRSSAAVKKGIESLPTQWKDIDILINNAGMAAGTDKIQDCKTEDWDNIIDTNVKGLLYVTRMLLPYMIARKTGQVINVGSIAGYDCYPGGHVYCASKHAVRALSQCMRIDLLGTGIRVTEIDPGIVETEFFAVRWNDKKRSDEFLGSRMVLKPEDIARSMVFAATQPPHVCIANIFVLPAEQASVHHSIVKTEKK